MNIKEMTIHNCACGKEHLTDMEHVDISQGAIKNIPDYLRSIDAKNVYVVADRNTYDAAGKQLEERLKTEGIEHDCYVIPDENEVVPNETTIVGILIGMKKKYDLIIAVGTGTINDICKFISSRMNMDYIICATAPSMDGFASIGAALMINNLKTTIDSHVPKAIFADIDVLKEAPMIMIQAGLGDIIGKYTCLCDWKLSSMINGEYYCEKIVSIVKQYINKVVETAPQVPSRSPEAIAAITEALVGTGIAMSFVGNSRPASGSEHHISHYWEMKFLFEHRTPALHGIKVGIGTVAILRLYEMLTEQEIDFESAKASIAAFDTEKWKEKIRESYGVSADGIIALEEAVQKNSKTAHAKRIQIIEEKWPDIIAMIKQELPSVAFVTSILEEIGAPTNPAQVGVEPSLVADSIVVAKEVRNRYGLLQLLWDLGISDEMGNRIAQYFQA
jgi:glycerol-1-phosphate dehydrogenase [NAD(P)+]